MEKLGDTDLKSQLLFLHAMLCIPCPLLPQGRSLQHPPQQGLSDMQRLRPTPDPPTQILHFNTFPGESVCTVADEKHYHTLLNGTHLGFSKEKVLMRLLTFQQKAHLSPRVHQAPKGTMQTTPSVADVALLTHQSAFRPVHSAQEGGRTPQRHRPRPAVHDADRDLGLAPCALG